MVGYGLRNMENVARSNANSCDTAATVAHEIGHNLDFRTMVMAILAQRVVLLLD